MVFGFGKRKPKSTDHLVELSRTISESVSTIERVCKKEGIAFPNLNEPFTPQSEAFRANEEAAAAAHKIAAAAYQLVASVLPPPASVLSLVSGHFGTAALRVCLEANVTEILREAGPMGLHINEIAQKAKLNPGKLGRLMRFLATQHVYKEITPDVFTNTRLSSVLDTWKCLEDIQADPVAKHDNTSGFPALLGHHLDEVPKSSAYMWETLSNPTSADSGEVTETPFNRAFNTDLPIWSWYETSEQEDRFKRFGLGMRGVQALQPPDAILSAYEWDTLPMDAVVVDVGGGVGTSSLPLAQKYKEIQLVIQDRPAVIDEGKKIWAEKLPKALESGQVRLEDHDFFTEQPVKNASVFLLKQIMHDWSDPYCVKILTKLREAAQPDTKLILIDSLIPYACSFPNTDEDSFIPGAVPKEAPAPLLANYGVSNNLGYVADLTMLTLFNSQERTVKHLCSLLRSTGWRLTRVQRSEGVAFLQPVVAVPIL